MFNEQPIWKKKDLVLLLFYAINYALQNVDRIITHALYCRMGKRACKNILSLLQNAQVVREIENLITIKKVGCINMS